MNAQDQNEINFTNPEHDIFFTDAEISDNFDYIQRTWIEYDNSEVKLAYTDAIRILKKLENSIIQHGVFSPNESLKEIPNENLK